MVQHFARLVKRDTVFLKASALLTTLIANLTLLIQIIQHKSVLNAKKASTLLLMETV